MVPYCFLIKKKKLIGACAAAFLASIYKILYNMGNMFGLYEEYAPRYAVL